MERGYKINSIHSRNAGVQAAPGFTRINRAPSGEEWRSGLAAYAVRNDDMPKVKKTYKEMRKEKGLSEADARSAALSSAPGSEMLQDASGNRVTKNPIFKNKE